ncbi:MAG: hypothetical protein ACRDMH_13125 [Solirubrobacterales bacterium]
MSDLTDQIHGFVGDPTKLPQLRDALQADAGRAIEAMRDPGFDLATAYSATELARRADAYEAIATDLASAMAVMGFWGTHDMGRVAAEVVGRLANAVDQSRGQDIWLWLTRYPALIVEYAAGLGAVTSGREAFLAPLLTSPHMRIPQRQEWRANVLVLHPGGVMEQRIGQALPGMERRHTPVSDRLFAALRDKLEGLLFDDASYEHVFDRFECLLGLVFYDVQRGDDGDRLGPGRRFQLASPARCGELGRDQGRARRAGRAVATAGGRRLRGIG